MYAYDDLVEVMALNRMESQNMISVANLNKYKTVEVVANFKKYKDENIEVIKHAP